MIMTSENMIKNMMEKKAYILSLGFQEDEQYWLDEDSPMNGVQQTMIRRKIRLGQRTSRDEDLWAVASGASQKSYSPSPDAESQRRKVFRGLHSHSPVHAGAQDEEGHGGDTVERRGKILTPIRLILVKAHRLYI